MKDLRTFLARLYEHDPEQIVAVDQEVEPEHFATSLVDRLRDNPDYPRYPAVLFKKVAGSQIPHLINLHGTYERLALSIDSTVQTMVDEFGRRESHPIQPVEVSRDAAPVKEVVLTGDDARLDVLPIFQHMELDAGKYITSGVSLARDPDSGATNAGIYRAQLHGPQELGFQVSAYQDTNFIMRRHRELGRPLEVAMVIGHHPALLLSGTTKPAGVGGELAVAGGLMQEALEMVPAETVDLMVPARAEIVIEGSLDLRPETYQEEGPFAEYPLYYTGTGPQPVFRVTAITHRSDAIYVGVFNASPEHLAIGGLAKMGFLLRRMRDVLPSVVNINLPVSGVARNHAYVSVRKRMDGEPHLAALNLLAYAPGIKHVFLVDDDIDVMQEEQVLWALATRFQADKDLIVMNNTLGSRLNPPAYAYRRDDRGALESKLIFDCTRPASPAKFPIAARVKPDVRAAIDLDALVRPAVAADMAGR